MVPTAGIDRVKFETFRGAEEAAWADTLVADKSKKDDEDLASEDWGGDGDAPMECHQKPADLAR